MTDRTLVIKGCLECPFTDKERQHTADSFEMEFRVFCTKTKRNDNTIANHVERDREIPKTPPKWCPLKEAK